MLERKTREAAGEGSTEVQAWMRAAAVGREDRERRWRDSKTASDGDTAGMETETDEQEARGRSQGYWKCGE